MAVLTWNWSVNLPKDPKSSKSNFISMEKFNIVCSMFGNFFLPEKKAIVIEMCEWVNKAWFHGVISRAECITRLELRDPGFFLIRLSLIIPGYPFTIDFVDQDRQAVHIRIKFEEDTEGKYSYVIQETQSQHQTLSEAITKSGFKLESPCPRHSVYSTTYETI